MSSPTSVLERIIVPSQGTLSEQVARYILGLAFPAEDVERYRALSDKAQFGALTESERADLDELLTANDVLMIMQSKARASLGQRIPAA